MNLKRSSVGFFLFYTAMTTVLSTTLTFVAPLPARYLHLQFGRLPYWAFTILSSSTLAIWQPLWGLYQFIILLSVGVFSDLQTMKFSTFYAAFASVGLSLAGTAAVFAVWAQWQGLQALGLLQAHLAKAIETTKEMQSVEIPLSVETLLPLMPAFISIVLMFLIFVSVVFVRQGRREPLTMFKVPDELIWGFIVTLAGSFLLDPVKAFWAQKVSFNLLYVLSAVFYFQGLSVTAFFFRRWQLPYIVKALLFFILAFQPPICFVPVAVGVADVWFHFRKTWFTNKILAKEN